MIVMPANATGTFFTCLARETGRLGHLYSPGAERGPWPWFPYALDNGCFSLWTPETNHFDERAWRDRGEAEWRRLIFWASAAPQKPMWAIVPDWPGDWTATARKYRDYVDELTACGIPLAIAVQDGCTVRDVRNLTPTPAVVFVGGSTEWKWATAANWIKHFPRVHVWGAATRPKSSTISNRSAANRRTGRAGIAVTARRPAALRSGRDRERPRPRCRCGRSRAGRSRGLR